MTRRAGLTLIELLLAASMTVILTLALTQGYITGVNFEKQASDQRKQLQARIAFEERVGDLIRHAVLNSSSTDRLTYFFGQQGNSIAQLPVTGTTGSSSSGGGGGSLAGSGSTAHNDNNFADTLVFTIEGQRVPSSAISSTDDWETQNKKYGVQGGTSEIAISMDVVGDATGKNGCLLRTQTPADGDPSQGGKQTVLDPDVTQLGFEFYNGTDWQPSWTTQNGTRRLPAAVRVTYRIQGDEQDRIFDVWIPASDVTSSNPASTGTTVQ